MGLFPDQELTVFLTETGITQDCQELTGISQFLLVLSGVEVLTVLTFLIKTVQNGRKVRN